MIKKNNINIESLLVPANIFRIACVDERKVQEVNKTNPVNLPGATYCLVDALKALYGYSEEDAWQVLSKVNIPICSHIDNHIVGDHEENGCGDIISILPDISENPPSQRGEQSDQRNA